MLLIGSATPSLLSMNEHRTSVLANDDNKTADCGCGSQQILTDRQTMTEIFINDTLNQSPSKPTIKQDLPPYFNWRDNNGTDWTTPAKDQESCGSCWDFAAIGALESVIQIREQCAAIHLDLSEQYVLSCLRSAGTCKGGDAYYAYAFIKKYSVDGQYRNGIIPEFCLPYQVNDKVSCTNKSPNWNHFLIPITSYGYWIGNGTIAGRNAIKTKILESGPVVATMMFTYSGSNNLESWGYTHHNSTEYYPYPGPINKTSINHQLVIVGWKDDPSIKNGGYWIVKNSISEEWGYNGFFNLEYGSLNIENSEIVWVDYNPANYSNWWPVAIINGSNQGHVNQAMTFNGSGSFDHEGSLVTYKWDFGDGSTGTGVTTTHTYPTQGIYQLSLTVTDNASNNNTQSLWVYIDKVNHPPKTPILTGRKIGVNGTTYQYTISSTDPDGDDVQYYLNWGDVYWFGGAAGWIGPFTSGHKITLEKTYADKGSYTIRVKAKDRYGVKSDWATLKVTMPYSYDIPFQPFWARFFEMFPNAFPHLRQLMGY